MNEKQVFSIYDFFFIDFIYIELIFSILSFDVFSHVDDFAVVDFDVVAAGAGIDDDCDGIDGIVRFKFIIPFCSDAGVND